MTVIRPLPVLPTALAAQQSAGEAAAAGQATASAPAPASLAAALAGQKAMLFAVLQQALTDAAPRQNGLAPLMADAQALLARASAQAQFPQPASPSAAAPAPSATQPLQQAAASGTALPQHVKQALQNLLALRLPADGNGGVEAAKLQQAVRQSGVFFEAALAQGLAPQGDVKAALLGLRQALQAWLAPQAGSAPAGAMPHAPASLPQPVREAALQVLAQAETALARSASAGQSVADRSDADLRTALRALLGRRDAPLPPAVRQAMDGVLAQRPAAGGSAQAGWMLGTLPVPAAGDAKALIVLRDALQGWLGPKTTVPSQPPSPPAPPAPPHRQAATVPQPPVPAGLVEDLPFREAGLRLLAGTDAALARHTLLQIASLPEDGTASRAQDGQKLVFDIPLSLPQGSAVMQLRVERDGQRPGADPRKSVWQAVFSIDVEPIGPVHARVALIGERANVALFAERGESAAVLRANLALLEAGLNEAAIEAGDLLCATGAPAAPAAAPGLFVDRAS